MGKEWKGIFSAKKHQRGLVVVVVETVEMVETEG